MDYAAFTDFVTRLTAETGDLILSVYRDPALAIELKGDRSPVTWADRRAEEVMRERIAAAFPDHGVIGEEHGEDRPDAEWVWVLDPIDGTRSFTAGCPLFGSLIGIRHGGAPRYGAIHLPALGDLYLGDGHSATRNGQRLTTRADVSLAEATLVYTDPVAPSHYQDGPRFERLVRSVGLARTWGDCFGYTLVAGGGADLAMDPVMNLWDLVALIPVVEGAGGVITDWQGAPAIGGTSALAAGSPALHQAALEVLRGP